MSTRRAKDNMPMGGEKKLGEFANLGGEVEGCRERRGKPAALAEFPNVIEKLDAKKQSLLGRDNQRRHPVLKGGNRASPCRL